MKKNVLRIMASMALALLLPLISLAQADVTITVTNLNPAYDNLWVKGAMDGWDGHALVQDGNVWTYTYEGVAEGTYAWGVYQGDEVGNQLAWLIVGDNPEFTVTGTNATGVTTYEIPAPGDSFDVEFTVTDESQTETLIKIKGSFTSWVEEDMTHQGNGIWTITLPVEVGSWEWGAVNDVDDWLIDKYGVEGGNRTFAVSETGVVTGQVELYLPALGDITIDFFVDMNDPIEAGEFFDDMDVLELVGSFNAFQGTLVDPEWQLTDDDSDGIYTLTSPAQFRPDQIIYFKFRINGNWDFAETPGDPSGKLNRKYTVDVVNENNIYNGIWGENYFNNIGTIEAIADINTTVGTTVGDIDLPATINVQLGTPTELTGENAVLDVVWDTDDFDSSVEGEINLTGTPTLLMGEVRYFNGYEVMATVKVVVGPGTNVNTNDFNVSIYPNPTTDFINVVANGIQNIKVYNMLGQEMINISNINANRQVVNTAALSNGIYIISVTDINGLTKTNRIVKR